MTRDFFEELCADLFAEIPTHIDVVLEESVIELEKGDIDEVVLLGGSSLIPKVQQLAKLYFDGKEPMTEATNLIDPAEAATRGAALKASLDSGA